MRVALQLWNSTTYNHLPLQTKIHRNSWHKVSSFLNEVYLSEIWRSINAYTRHPSVFSGRKAGIISCLLSWALSIAVSDQPQSNAGQYRLLAPCKGIRKNFACGIQNPGLWTLDLKESGILLKIGIQNPSSTDNDWNPASKAAEFLISLERLFQLEALKRNTRSAAEIRN